MKIIDLLNKIANGQEVPKKIKYNLKTYFYDNEEQDYCDYDKTYGLVGDYLENNYGLHNCLNDEVEIIEEEKKIPENNFTYIYFCEDDHITANFENIKTTLKDIIDYLKSKGE